MPFITDSDTYWDDDPVMIKKMVVGYGMLRCARSG